MKFGIPDSFDLEVEAEPILILRPSSPPHSFNPSSSLSSSSSTIQSENEILFMFPKIDNSHKLNEIDILTKKFESIISLQNNQVKKLIEQENERIRKKKEEEESQRLEMEKQKKLLQEKRQREEVERLKKLEEEKKKKQEEENLKKLQEEEAKRKQDELKAKEKAKQDELNRIEKLKQDKINEEKNKFFKIEKDFNNYISKIKSIKIDIVEKVNNDKDLKKQIGIVRRKINPKFGQLSNSNQQLNKITNEIIEIINTIPTNIPLVLPFIFNFISKALISQAETEIVVQPNAAIPLAKLASNLILKFPELNDYLMPRFVKKCPLVIGYSCNIDTEEGRIRMGWRRNKSNGKWEESDKYDERVSGICSLFSVLTSLNNPLYPISMSWSMLARIANTDLKLLTNVHFFCISNWWESCGKYFVSIYKNQAFKLLKLLSYNLATQFKRLPAATRLVILGEEGISLNMKGLKAMSP